MALVVKNKKIVVESEKQYWDKAIKLGKAIDKGKAPMQTEELSFPDLETLRKTLTPKRLKIIRVIKHKQPESIYQLARIMKTDYKNLIKDINKLKIIGLVDIKKEKGNERRMLLAPIVNFDSLEIKIAI